MNLVAATTTAGGLQLEGGLSLSLRVPETKSTKVTSGLRASALRVSPQEGDVSIQAKVELAEISGSDTFVHLETLAGELVAQLTGVHFFEAGEAVTLYFNPAQIYVFRCRGMLLLSPSRRGEH